MSTQTRFDLDGFSHAIGSRDARYQLALYADNAEVEIVDADHPEVPLQVLRGKSDIREWLDSMSSGAVRYEVKDAVAHQHGLRFTEECRYPDGTDLRYECRAEVYRGQITHESVRVVCQPRDRVPTGLDQDRSEGASVESSSAWPPAPGLTRSLPGNFLG